MKRIVTAVVLTLAVFALIFFGQLRMITPPTLAHNNLPRLAGGSAADLCFNPRTNSFNAG